MSMNAAFAALLLFSTAAYLALGVRLFFAKREIGTVPIGLLFVVISVWVVGGAIEQLSSSFFMFSIGRTCHFVGSAFVPVVAYVCFREYIGKKTSIHRTNDVAHDSNRVGRSRCHKLRTRVHVVSAGDERYGAVPDAAGGQWGPWFLFVHLPHGYIVIGMGLLALLTHTIRGRAESSSRYFHLGGGESRSAWRNRGL